MPRPEPSPRSAPEPQAGDGVPGWRREALALDVAVYAAISATPTPTLDRFAGALSRAADGSKLWFGVAGVLAVTGAHGRRAAVDGTASVAVTSGVVNLVLKPWSHIVPERARGVGFRLRLGRRPRAARAGRVPLQVAAALVAYSRLHTGVHYPVDVIAGSIVGAALGDGCDAARRCPKAATGRRCGGALTRLGRQAPRPAPKRGDRRAKLGVGCRGEPGHLMADCVEQGRAQRRDVARLDESPDAAADHQADGEPRR